MKINSNITTGKRLDANDLNSSSRRSTLSTQKDRRLHSIRSRLSDMTMSEKINETEFLLGLCTDNFLSGKAKKPAPDQSFFLPG